MIDTSISYTVKITWENDTPATIEYTSNDTIYCGQLSSNPSTILTTQLASSNLFNNQFINTVFFVSCGYLFITDNDEVTWQEISNVDYDIAQDSTSKFITVQTKTPITRTNNILPALVGIAIITQGLYKPTSWIDGKIEYVLVQNYQTPIYVDVPILPYIGISKSEILQSGSSWNTGIDANTNDILVTFYTSDGQHIIVDYTLTIDITNNTYVITVGTLNSIDPQCHVYAFKRQGELVLNSNEEMV